MVSSKPRGPSHLFFRRTLLLLVLLVGPVSAQTKHPLEPPPTGSPRETIETFLSSVEDVWRQVLGQDLGHDSRAAYMELERAVDRAKRTLDFSELPVETRREVGNEKGVQLYEVLCRIELPPLSEIPGPAEVKEQELESWTIPHTEITLRRVAEGPRTGEFLFSKETIARVEEFYEHVEHLPYLRKPPIENLRQWRSVYGGWRISRNLVDGLPARFRTLLGGQAVWKWIALGLIGVVFVVTALVVFRLTRRGARPAGIRSHSVELVFPLALYGMSVLAARVLTVDINFTGDFGSVAHLSLLAIAYLALGWAVWLLGLLGSELIIASPRVRAESLDADLIRLAGQVVGVAGATAIVFHGANRLGVPVVGVIASLSVGGLAVALAAQDTLRSLLASMTILMDQPYRVGERIIVDGHDGFVQRIGLRSTRILKLNGSVTSIPNEVIATKDVENVGRRGSVRRLAKLRLASDTPAAKLEEAVEIVRELLRDHEGMPEGKPARVFFDEFNDDSFSLLVCYWYAPPDYWASLEFAQRFNLDLVRRFEAAGIQLAPPTSRMELVGEGGRPRPA